MVSILTSLTQISQVTEMHSLDMWHTWSLVLWFLQCLTQTGSLSPM